LIIAIKNVISFGFSWGASPWIIHDGFKKPFAEMAGIAFASILLGFPLYIYGKRLRFATAKWKLVLS
jgi:hypothetical protein